MSFLSVSGPQLGAVFLSSLPTFSESLSLPDLTWISSDACIAVYLWTWMTWSLWTWSLVSWVSMCILYRIHKMICTSSIQYNTFSIQMENNPQIPAFYTCLVESGCWEAKTSTLVAKLSVSPITCVYNAVFEWLICDFVVFSLIPWTLCSVMSLACKHPINRFVWSSAKTSGKSIAGSLLCKPVYKQDRLISAAGLI